MAVKILTCNSEYESACRLGFPTKTQYGDYAYKSDGDIVIRWGNSVSVFERGGKEVEFQQVINPSKAIKLNCQKHKATKAMALVVNVPTLYEKSVPKDVLAVIRPIEHSAGVGFSVQKGPLQIQKGTYGTRYLKTDAEYRVWFCGNRTMCGRRVKMKINETQEFPCRSNWGYEFSDGIAPELHYQTLMVANKIGLETGAADVLFYKRKYYFLELNSAPSVDHRIVREFFQKALNELIEAKFTKKAEAPKPAEPEKKSAVLVENPVVVASNPPAEPVQGLVEVLRVETPDPRTEAPAVVGERAPATPPAERPVEQPAVGVGGPTCSIPADAILNIEPAVLGAIPAAAEPAHPTIVGIISAEPVQLPTPLETAKEPPELLVAA